MGLLDHHRTWRYDVNAPPEERIGAFRAAFEGRPALIANGDWDFALWPRTAVANERDGDDRIGSRPEQPPYRPAQLLASRTTRPLTLMTPCGATTAGENFRSPSITALQRLAGASCG